jgi:PEP-CTERM motif
MSLSGCLSKMLTSRLYRKRMIRHGPHFSSRGVVMVKINVSAVLGILVSSMSPAYGAAVVFSIFGPDAASITPTRDAFRVVIGGGTVAGANGSFGGVRREINWDAVPDALSAPNNLPANFFNVNSPRGVVFSSSGTGFQVSANAGVAPIQFDNVNATYSATFEPFSAQKLFTSLGSNIMDVNFFLPGTNTPASTNAFGVIFSDVDVVNTTSLQFFDPLNNSLGTFFAPAGVGSETFSFLGVQFNAGERIGRVRITSGNVAVGPNDATPTSDVVTMDDFIYAEAAVPEPTSLLLIGGGLIVLGLARKKLVRWNS